MTTTKPINIRREFSNNSETLNEVNKCIDNICSVANISDEYYGNILIAVSEAVNNAIKHGNKNNINKKIFMFCDEKATGGISIFVEDQGTGFDYDNLPDPTLPENIEKENGRGIFLMRSLADKITFTEKGKVVELYFELK